MRIQYMKVALALGATASLYAAEVSVFGAGNLQSATPYGLTQNEKLLLEKTQEVDRLSRQLATMQNDVGAIKEQMEGVRSVLDGTATRVGRSDGDMRALGERLKTLEEKILILETSLEEHRSVQAANNERLRVVLGEMSSLIDSINSSYASKSTMEEMAKRLDALEAKKSSAPSPSASSIAALEAKPGAELMQEALNFFNAENLDEAWVRYDILVKKNYMPARSNYFLGEIAYKKQQWRTAIKHYKISIDLYDKAEYIPRLLYHTAISFDKIGEPNNAAPFYRALKANYPNSKEAQASPNR